MSFEVISEEGHEDYEVWTCDKCGYSITLNGVGGDVCECPNCLYEEYEEESSGGKSVDVEPCGCEFTTFYERGYSQTLLTKCKCEKHYEEQLIAEWYDRDGHHKIKRLPDEVPGLIPLQK